jgi:hypothetical protein
VEACVEEGGPAVAQHLVDTLNKFNVPEKEHKELMAIIATLRPDIVEVEGK